MLSVVIQALKKPVMFLCMLCAPFENRCLMYSGWAFEITHLAYTNYHHLITEPNLIPIRPKLLSSTVDSDGRTLHVPNLIRGEKKYHPYCLK